MQPWGVGFAALPSDKGSPRGAWQSTGLLPLLLWGFPEETKHHQNQKLVPGCAGKGTLQSCLAPKAGQPLWQREQHSALPALLPWLLSKQ